VSREIIYSFLKARRNGRGGVDRGQGNCDLSNREEYPRNLRIKKGGSAENEGEGNKNSFFYFKRREEEKKGSGDADTANKERIPGRIHLSKNGTQGKEKQSGEIVQSPFFWKGDRKKGR